MTGGWSWIAEEEILESMEDREETAARALLPASGDLDGGFNFLRSDVYIFDVLGA